MLRHHTNLAVALATLAAQHGWLDRPAIIASGHTRSYAEVFAMTQTYAAGLNAAGVRSGDRILILMPDGFDCVTTLLGAMWIGAVPVLGNPRLPRQELSRLVHRAEPTVAVCADETAQVLPGVRQLLPEHLSASSQTTPPPETIVDGQPGYGLFTSGTTGDPKLCLHSHADPLVHNRAYGKPVLGLSPGDTVHSVSKLNFAYGLGNSVWFPLLNGATAILEATHPTAERVLDIISAHQVDILFAVPSFYAKLLAHPDSAALAQLRIAVSAGEVLPPAIERRIMALNGPVLLNSIGSTEVGQAFASNSPRAHKFGSVGRALPPYQVRVVDRAREQVPAEVEGSLEVAGPTMAQGLRSIGVPGPPSLWHPTGDVAIVDADGYLTVMGRVDDVEIVGGINVHPTEIEQALLDFPTISDVAVCAVTDESGISRLVAYVVSATPPGELAELTTRIQNDLRHRIAGFKVPHTVVVVAEVPRTDTGKLRRNVLRAAAREFQSTGSWQLNQ
ncbi:AMP-binding protein [Nocardia sp. NPDC003979]